jgi:hypothetical protein
MRRIAVGFALLGVAVAGCGKSEGKKREEVLNCSATSIDAKGISACLVALYRWKEHDASVAAQARQHEVDSTAAFQRDSAWHIDAAKHRQELAKCADARGDVAECLEDNFAWDAERATAAFDSLWRAEGSSHRGQIQTCVRQRKSSVGSCLMLYYKWDPKHALALGDSIERAKMKALNNR